MATSIDRRTFLKGASVAAAATIGAPLVSPARAVAAGDRLVVAVGQWGIETPFAWRSRPPFDEPVLAWQRCIYSKGPFNLLADGPYDEDVDTISRELDVEKRARMTQALAQKLYDEYRGVMLGMRSLTWAVSKKVNSWPTLVYVPLENNYEYVS